MKFGIEFTLDNDWSPAGEARRMVAGRSRGVSLFGSLDAPAEIIEELA